MAYREKRIYSGKILEVEVYPVTKQETKQPRRKKTKISTPKQRNLNNKNARKHLSRLINTNFTDKDLVAHVTYRNEELPSSEEEAKRDVVNFIRRIKYYRKKNRITAEFKYIAVIEYKESENEEKVRMHHHIIITGDMDRDKVEEIWGKGWVNTKRLQADEYGYEALAKYISKAIPEAKESGRKKGSKRWTQSRNLQQPIVRVNDHKYTKRKVEKISRCPEDRETFENLYRGYIFNNCRVTINEYTAGIYLHIRMRKLE